LDCDDGNIVRWNQFRRNVYNNADQCDPSSFVSNWRFRIVLDHGTTVLEAIKVISISGWYDEN
jgi:methyl coenzyme M reductase gamma subunit